MSSSGPLNPGDKQNSILGFAQSPVGKKILTGVTGLGLLVFVVVHMLGNFLLFLSRDRFNLYAESLSQLKPLLWLIEFGLLLFIGVHSFLGIQIFIKRRQSRPEPYGQYQSAGAPSHQTWSSRNMIVTGMALAIFLTWHLWTFKFGHVYTIEIAGRSMRDLAQLVIETFQKPLYTLFYGVFLAILFLHLRHGIWSALQSTALIQTEKHPQFYWLCTSVAFVLFLGFMSPPIAILLGGVR